MRLPIDDARSRVDASQVSGMQMRGLHRESSDRLDIRFAGRPECLARHEEQLRTMAASLEMKPSRSKCLAGARKALR